MIIYFAGTDGKLAIDAAKGAGAKNVLTSYWIRRKSKSFAEYEGLNVFLDSGAFSAASKGKVINIEEYADFCATHDKSLKVYANLDVIGDYVGTAKNQAFLESKGIYPLPVFHYKTPMSVLEEMISRYDYLALGGLVPLKTEKPELMNWLDKCFTVLIKPIRERGLKVHSFGVTTSWVLKRYPFYSADSTKWIAGELFANVVRWNPEEMKMYSLKYKDRDHALEHGLPIELHDKYGPRRHHNVVEFLKMEKAMTELWAKRGIIYAS